jgi:hypothetical protein
MITLSSKDVLPEDGTRGTLVGRIFLPQTPEALPWSQFAMAARST